MMLIGLGFLAVVPQALLYGLLMWLFLALGWMPATFLGCMAVGAALALVSVAFSVLSQLGVLRSFSGTTFQTV